MYTNWILVLLCTRETISILHCTFQGLATSGIFFNVFLLSLSQYSFNVCIKKKKLCVAVYKGDNIYTSLCLCVAVSDNLIDLSCEGTAPGPLRSEPEYVNDAVIRQKQLMDQRDPFDMREYWGGRGAGVGGAWGRIGLAGVSTGGGWVYK